MKAISTLIAVTGLAASLISGCSTTSSGDGMGLFSDDGVQGSVITAPALAQDALADGSVVTQPIGINKYAERALDLIDTLHPVSFAFLDSGELSSFSINGEDPVVVAAGGRMVVESVTLDRTGKIVTWEPAAVASESGECQIVITIIDGPPRQTIYSCNNINCQNTCVPSWIEVGEVLIFTAHARLCRDLGVETGQVADHSTAPS